MIETLLTFGNLLMQAPAGSGSNDAVEFVAGILTFLCVCLGLLSPFIFLGLGFFISYTREKKHFENLAAREQALSFMVVTDLRVFPGGADPRAAATLVTGEAVLAGDYFKAFIGGFKKLIGGEMGMYTPIIARARREAVLRLMESANNQGYNAIANIRIEPSDIGMMRGPQQKGIAVGVVASGTAYRIPRT